MNECEMEWVLAFLSLVIKDMSYLELNQNY